MSRLPVAGGTIIGRPYQGTHTRGNWQSDNAADIKVPVGTPVYAVHSGVIGPNIGPFSSSDPALAGERLTVQWTGNASYYAHLSKILVRPGQRVNEGELLGYSGSANGVAHLHWALEHGSPIDWLRGLPSKVAAAAAGAASSSGAMPTTAAAGSSPALGCATMLVLGILPIAAAILVYAATGAPLWP